MTISEEEFKKMFAFVNALSEKYTKSIENENEALRGQLAATQQHLDDVLGVLDKMRKDDGSKNSKPESPLRYYETWGEKLIRYQTDPHYYHPNHPNYHYISPQPLPSLPYRVTTSTGDNHQPDITTISATDSIGVTNNTAAGGWNEASAWGEYRVLCSINTDNVSST
jgi:hypothetical protein